MSRRAKKPEPVTELIRLYPNPDVTVLITAPAGQWPCVRRVGRYVIVAIDEESMPQVLDGAVRHAPQPVHELPSGGDRMTAEERQQAAEALGIPLRPRPFNSEDAFHQAGAPLGVLAQITRAAEESTG